MSRNPFILRQGEVARVMDACDKLAALRAENARLGEALCKSRTNIECLLYMSGSQAARIEFGKASIAVIDAALEARP